MIGSLGLRAQRNYKAVYTTDRLNHVTWMADEASGFTDSIKANRWLGFIQGVLWAFGMKSVESIDEDNKPLGDWYTAVVMSPDYRHVFVIQFQQLVPGDVAYPAAMAARQQLALDPPIVIAIFKGEQSEVKEHTYVYHSS